MQGDIPKLFATLRRLRTLNLSRNKLTRGFGDFQSTVQRGNALINLQLQDNGLRGVLFPPKLVDLGMFGSRDFEPQESRKQPHVFNVADNNLEGEVTDELVNVRRALLLCQLLRAF